MPRALQEVRRSYLVEWLGLATVAVFVIAYLRPAPMTLDRLGIGWPPVINPAALAVAGLVAGATLGLRRYVSRAAWWHLQLATAVAHTVWTTSLILAGSPRFDGEPVGTFIGDSLARGLEGLSEATSIAPALIVGLLSAAGVVLLSAAIQSLSGQTQARKIVPALVLSPAAAFADDGLVVLSLTSAAAVLALSAMSSERGRGPAWQASLGLLAGTLLFVGALAGLATVSAGLGMLCIYFLRRRPMMILMSGGGAVISMVIAAALGWSLPRHMGEAADFRFANAEALLSTIVVGVMVALALGGPALRESMRKYRGTPAWPVIVTGGVALVLALLTRPTGLPVVPAAVIWIPLLVVAASAPPSHRKSPHGPWVVGLALTAACGLVAATMS